MDKQNAFYQKVGDLEREERKKARKAKWKKREEGFWKTFLFTEDGKPKSGFLIYTFCLSFVFVGLYIAGFYFVTEGAAMSLATAMPAFWGNLILSLIVGAAGAALSALLHILLPDKRLAFGTHIWLALYIVAAVITLCIMLKDWEAIQVMLVFVLWFAAIPVTMGLIVTYLLYRKDYVPPQEREEKPVWKQYTERR